MFNFTNLADVMHELMRLDVEPGTKQKCKDESSLEEKE